MFTTVIIMALREATTVVFRGDKRELAVVERYAKSAVEACTEHGVAVGGCTSVGILPCGPGCFTFAADLLFNCKTVRDRTLDRGSSVPIAKGLLVFVLSPKNTKTCDRNLMRCLRNCRINWDLGRVGIAEFDRA